MSFILRLDTYGHMRARHKQECAHRFIAGARVCSSVVREAGQKLLVCNLPRQLRCKHPKTFPSKHRGTHFLNLARNLSSIHTQFIMKNSNFLTKNILDNMKSILKTEKDNRNMLKLLKSIKFIKQI